MPRPHGSLARAAGVLLAAALIPILPFAIIGELPGDRWLALSEGDALRFGAVGGGLLALDVLLPIPSSIIGALLGGRLGFFAGFAWAFGGLCTGQLLGYAAGRFGHALWDRWAGHARARGREAGRQDGPGEGAPTFALIFASRPVPVLAEAVSIASGVERVPFRRFALAGLLGNACYAAALAADGAALLPDGLAGPGLILPMLVPVLAFWLWRRLAPAH